MDYKKILDKMKSSNIFLLLIVGILFVIVGNSFFMSDTKEPDVSPVLETPEPSQAAGSYEEMLAKRIEEVLSKAEGVGKIEVLLTVSYNETVVAEEVIKDETSTVEKTQEGATRDVIASKSENKAVMLNQSDGSTKPLVLKEAEPTIEGVVIVAEGGDDPSVVNALTKSAEALLNVPSHKILVLKMKS